MWMCMYRVSDAPGYANMQTNTINGRLDRDDVKEKKKNEEWGDE